MFVGTRNDAGEVAVGHLEESPGIESSWVFQDLS